MIKITLIDMPALKVTYDARDGEKVAGALRLNYPKYPQLILAGNILDKCKPQTQINIIDMKTKGSIEEQLYKKIERKGGTYRFYQVGTVFDSIKEEVKDSDIIGLTSNFTQSSNIVFSLIASSKKVSKAKVFVGGTDATARPKIYLEKGADVVFLGESDDTLPKAIESVVDRKNLEEISGIAFKTKRSIRINRPELRVDLENISLPALSLVDLEEYTEFHNGQTLSSVRVPLMYLEASRGCKETCPYCSVHFMKPGYRYISTSKLEKILKHYKKHRIDSVTLIEDNILSRMKCGKRESVIDMFKLLKGYEFTWEFGNGIEFGKLINKGNLDTELMETLFWNSNSERYLGCHRVEIPLESLRERPEKEYQKLRNWDTEKKLIRNIAETRVPLFFFNVMVGRADETNETLELIKERCLEVKNLIEDYKAKSWFAFFVHTPLPGTSDYQKYKTLLAYDVNKHPEMFHFNVGVINGRTFSPEDITIKRRELSEEINGKQATEYWDTHGKYYYEGN